MSDHQRFIYWVRIEPGKKRTLQEKKTDSLKKYLGRKHFEALYVFKPCVAPAERTTVREREKTALIKPD